MSFLNGGNLDYSPGGIWEYLSLGKNPNGVLTDGAHSQHKGVMVVDRREPEITLDTAASRKSRFCGGISSRLTGRR